LVGRNCRFREPITPIECYGMLVVGIRGNGTVGWERLPATLIIDKTNEFDRDRFAFVAEFCIR
jgi:hypothetical protein